MQTRPFLTEIRTVVLCVVIFPLLPHANVFNVNLGDTYSFGAKENTQFPDAPDIVDFQSFYTHWNVEGNWNRFEPSASSLGAGWLRVERCTGKFGNLYRPPLTAVTASATWLIYDINGVLAGVLQISTVPSAYKTQGWFEYQGNYALLTYFTNPNNICSHTARVREAVADRIWVWKGVDEEYWKLPLTKSEALRRGYTSGPRACTPTMGEHLEAPLSDGPCASKGAAPVPIIIAHPQTGRVLGWVTNLMNVVAPDVGHEQGDYAVGYHAGGPQQPSMLCPNSDSRQFLGSDVFSALHHWFVDPATLADCSHQPLTANIPSVVGYFAGCLTMDFTELTGQRFAGAIGTQLAWAAPLLAATRLGQGPFTTPEWRQALSGWATDSLVVHVVGIGLLRSQQEITDFYWSSNLLPPTTFSGLLISAAPTGNYRMWVPFRYIVTPTEIVDINVLTVFRFSECDTKISSMSLYFPSRFLAFQQAKIGSVTDFCLKVQQSCTGAHQQYSSLTDCILFLQQRRVQSCADLPGMFKGDSLGCRAYHAHDFSEPSVHCANVGKQPVKCQQVNCIEPTGNLPFNRQLMLTNADHFDTYLGDGFPFANIPPEAIVDLITGLDALL